MKTNTQNYFYNKSRHSNNNNEQEDLTSYLPYSVILGINNMDEKESLENLRISSFHPKEIKISSIENKVRILK